MFDQSQMNSTEKEMYNNMTLAHGYISFAYLMGMSTKSQDTDPTIPLEYVVDPVNARLPKAFLKV